MDDALKARLIGATVLVALAVLLIPELLSGRKPVEPATAQAGAADTARAPSRSTWVAPATGGPSSRPRGCRGPAPATGRRRRCRPPAPAPAPAAATARAPVVTGTPTAASATRMTEAQPPPASAAPVAAPEPRPEAVAGPLPGRRQRRLRQEADGRCRLAPSVRRDGRDKLVRRAASPRDFAAYVAPLSRSGKTLHRVRVGPEADRAGAEGLAARLKARGLPATVVASD